MDQQTSDQEWQQLQANVEGFFSQTLTNNVPIVEYKPRFITLLEMTSEHHQNNLQKTDV